MVVLVVELGLFVVPITLYFKGDKQDISKKEINDHLEATFFELKAAHLLERGKALSS